jgi:outer membrane receptor protein involved in Fe transport
MSGPLFQLPGGPANLTFAVQRESTIIKTARNSISDGTEDGRSYVIFPGRKQRTDSQYAEMVLPLIGQSKKLPFVNLLELRGAIRRDAYFTAGPPAGDSFIDFNLGNGTLFTQIGGFGSIATSDPDLVAPAFSPVTSRFRSTNFTFAGRYSPVEGVMFRASYATGFLPPSVVQISSSSFPAPFGIGFRDPQRGNEVISYPLQQIAGTGSTALRPEKSKSLSAGLILTPVDGLRFSADYTRIRKTDEIGSIPHPFLLANPDLFPGRVVRGPASDGFAVGRIITLDVTPINLLRSQVQSVDFQVDYEKGLKQWGQLRLYALASWQPDTVRQLIPAAPSLNFSGNRDGPLEWQGNAGFDWTLGKLTVRWNTQFYDSYRIITTQDISSDFARSLNEAEIKQQGALRVPSQLYSDIQLSYEMDESWGALGGLRISAGVQNIFNKKPPVIAIDSYQAAGYSTYGDPRLRRFTLTLRKAFFSSAPTK